MKRVAFLLILMTICILACRKIKQLANINVNIPYSYDLAVPAYIDTISVPSNGGLDVDLPVIPIQTNSKQYLDQYHTSSSKIVDLKLKSLTLKIIQPPGGNFNFVSAMSAYISASSLPEVQVASVANIPKGVDSVTMICSGADLRDYFLSETMYVRMMGHFTRVPPPNTTFRIQAVFALRANPLY